MSNPLFLPALASAVGLWALGPGRSLCASSCLSASGTVASCSIRTQRQLSNSYCTPRNRLLWAALGVALAGFLYFEVYFTSFQCKVSDRYQAEVRHIVTTLLPALDALREPYWLDFATLLVCLRGQTILPWDQDSDIGMLHPGPAGVDALRHRIEVATGFVTSYQPHRALIQVALVPERTAQGAHVDIWLYTREDHGEQPPALCNSDDQMQYHCRSEAHMFPLSHAMWLGMNVTIPHAAHAISRIVYGPGYVDTVRYRADCLHNTFHGRLWY